MNDEKETQGAAQDEPDFRQQSHAGDGTTQAAEDGKFVTVGLVRAHVKRGEDTIVTDVPEHELDLLKASHGEGSVSVDKGFNAETDLDDDAQAEHDRLVRKYTLPVVQRVFPDVGSVAKASGMKKPKPPQADE